MLFERPRRSGSVSTGDPTTLGEVWDRDLQAQYYSHNVNAGVRGTEEAYDARIDAVEKATGVRLVNPFRSPVGSTAGAFGIEQHTGDPFAFFEGELARLAENRPEFRDIIAPDRSPALSATKKANLTETVADDVYSRAPFGAGLVRFAAGLRGSLEDPANLLTMMLGPTGRVGMGAREVLWMGAKAGAANAAAETALQPVIQDWRRQAGLDYGASHAAMNIATAGVLGFGLDAGIRSGFRGVQAARGQVPILDKDGKVTGYKPAGAAGEAAGGQTQPAGATLPSDPESALDAAARAAPDGSVLRRAADGDPAALDELTAALGIADDPAVRGARRAMDLEAGEWRAAGVLDADGYDQMIAALRHAENPDAHPPARGADVVPEARGERISDDADAGPLGRAFEKDGKPVTFRAFDPQKIVADPETFQFRRQVNKSGTTGRMSGIQTWDPMASGKIVAFERLDGEIAIADGHHRLELAQRLAEQKPELTGYLFRERDGWTTADVRAYAAKKNMMDSPRVDPIDAASALRERPDLIDKSVAGGDEAMRQARALAKLSDEAFGMTVGGVLPPNYAALIGDLAPDKSRHASLVAELASIEPANIREARFALAEIMALPVHVEEQLTLLGGWKIERSLMKERMGVLDAALKLLRDDKRVFGLLEREAERIAGAGNRLDAAGNAARADSAAQVAALIESLAVQRGPVSDWLTDAARAVASGDFSKRQSAQAFVKRIADTYDQGGLAALTRTDTPLRAGGFDDPVGPEAQAQVKGLEQQFAREIEAATKPDKARAREAVLLDASNSIRSARTMEQWEEIWQELRRTMQMLPPDVKLRVEERIIFPETGGEVAGMWDGYDRLVYVALAAGDPVRTARHEVVHALRQSGLLSDAEFDTLYRFADKLGLRQAYQIDELYKANYTKAYGDRGADAVEALLREETIANMFSDYSLNGRRFGDVQGGGVIDKMIDEIVSFLKEIRDFLGVRGFRDVTDVFEAIESGAVARRAMRDVEMPGGGKMFGLHLAAISAYHGTPHTFAPEPGAPAGRFRLDRIGTGEGAQVYGHGLYFAENQKIAKWYRDQLGDAGWGGEKIPFLSGRMATGSDDIGVAVLLRSYGGHDAALSRYQSLRSKALGRARADAGLINRMRGKLEGSESYRELQRIEQQIKLLEDSKARGDVLEMRGPGDPGYPSGRLYEVRINADPEDFLDYEAGMVMQPPKVKAAARQVFGGDVSLYSVQELLAALSVDKRSSSDPAWGNPAAAAHALRDAGIAGVRYLDASSRRAGDGTRNYVVFDDSLIEIVAVDGKPVVSLANELAGVERIGDVKDVVEACK